MYDEVRARHRTAQSLPRARALAAVVPSLARLRLAEEVTRGPAASADCVDSLKQHFIDAEIVELTLTASFYVCVSRFLQSMDVDLEPGFESHRLEGKEQ